MEPGAVIEHHAEEVLLVLSAGTGDAAAVFAADIDCIAERHFRYAVPALTVGVIVFHLDAVVLVNTLHPRPVDGSACAHVRADGGVGITTVLRMAKRVYGPGSGWVIRLTVQVILADGVAVEHQFERVVRYPEDLAAEARLAVELGIGLPAIDEPGLDLQSLCRPPLDAKSVEEPRSIRRHEGGLVGPVIIVVIAEQADVRDENAHVDIEAVVHVEVIPGIRLREISV